MSENIDLKILEIIKRNIPLEVSSQATEFSLEEIIGNIPIASMGITSRNFTAIAVALETEFDFEFEDDELSVHHFRTIHDLACYVKKRMAAEE